MNKPRLTKEQRKAVEEYERCLREEDRYFGSVFVNLVGTRRIEEKTKAAYERACRLGVGYLC